MKIYEFRFAYDKRVDHALVVVLNDKGYHVLEWENGKLVVATAESFKKAIRIGKLISANIGEQVLCFSWSASLTRFNEATRLGGTAIQEIAREEL